MVKLSRDDFKGDGYMQFEFVSKRAVIAIAGFVLALTLSGVAQEQRSEISIEGTGFFTKDTTGNGVHDRATNTGGFLVGYRYNINR